MARRVLLALVCLSSFAVQAAADEPRGATSPRQTAAKKLADAREALRKAIAALADAEKAVAGAADESTRQEAEKQAGQARKALDAARREVARQNTEALKAAADAAVARRVLPRGAQPERPMADPQDPVERFALLTPGGPLIVEATLTIDGQPFRQAREKVIDSMLAAADKDQDGKPTWEEALAAPRFTLGRIRLPPGASTDGYIKSFDTIANGLVDREELRQFVARMLQGPAFMVGGPAGFRGGLAVVNGRVVSGSAGQADVLALLDTNSDGSLDKLEMAAAADRLKSRDADDNDVLEAGEISGNQALYPRPVDFPQQPQQQRAVLLGPAANAEPLAAALWERYKTGQGKITSSSFPAMPELFAALDKDDSKKLDADEVLGLNEIQPHVALAVDLSASRSAKGLSLTSLAASIGEAKEASPDSIVLSIPGAKVALAANRLRPQTDFKQNAEAMLARFDTNKNGYLEKEESGALGQQFELWDADGDGKAFPAEIAASYEQALAPRSSQIVVSMAVAENSLFSSLDASGDLRLGAREIRSAGERIQRLDANSDGRITAEEMPAMIVATFGLGSAGYGGYSAPPVPPRAISAPAPQWFTRMDRNGDGDLSLKEFLGSGSDFRQLDANGDGFVEAQEAAASRSAASR